jgi:hypothetical protein
LSKIINKPGHGATAVRVRTNFKDHKSPPVFPEARQSADKCVAVLLKVLSMYKNEYSKFPNHSFCDWSDNMMCLLTSCVSIVFLGTWYDVI